MGTIMPDATSENGPDDRLLISVKDVARILGVGVRTVWRMASSGDLPQPVTVGGRLKRWEIAAMETWAQATWPAAADLQRVLIVPAERWP